MYNVQLKSVEEAKARAKRQLYNLRLTHRICELEIDAPGVPTFAMDRDKIEMRDNRSTIPMEQSEPSLLQK